MPQGAAAPGDTRVILHIDLDCFYAQASDIAAPKFFIPHPGSSCCRPIIVTSLQVEQRRLNIPREVPVAVQQWDGLIAVNYAARAKGITRHMRVAEARLKCPELTLVHVETIGGGEPNATTNPELDLNSEIAQPSAASGVAGGAAGEPQPGVLVGDIDGGGASTNTSTAHLRLTQKACLERYRRANAEILKVLHKLAPTSVIEKASIDEVYIDVTSMVDAELEAQHGTARGAGYGRQGADTCLGDEESELADRDRNIGRPEDAFSWGSVVPGGPLDPGSEFDVRLACGAGIACRLRGAIRDELGFTSSAGIACNKLLAKIGSTMHKPNQQTVIPPRAVPALMHDLPLKKLRNFGGKLGLQLESMGCTTAGQVAALPLDTLKKTFGPERAQLIIESVGGRNNDPVEEKERPKSMLAAKSFSATSDYAALRRWFGVLSAELAPRMASDEEAFRRRARTLTVHFRGGAAPGQDRSRQGPMPRMPHNGTPCAETIAGAAWEIFKARCAGEALPCNRLAISAGEFAAMPSQGKSAITNFLVAKKPGTAAAPAAASNGTRSHAEDGEGGAGALLHDNDRKRPAEGVSSAVLDSSECNRAKHGDNYSSHAAAAAGPAVGEAPQADLTRSGNTSLEELPAELLGVDIAEQKRLLKEAAMLKALDDGRKKGGGSGGGGAAANKGKGGQSNISRFFVKKN